MYVCVCLHVHMIATHNVFLTLLSYSLSFCCPLVFLMCVSVNQQCLLDGINPAKHVRVHNIRKAQSRAFRGGNIHTQSYPHTTSSLPEIHKLPWSSLKPQIYRHTHMHTHSTWPLSVFARLVLPASSDRHMDLSRHATPSHNTALLRTVPWCLAPVAPSYQGRQSSVPVC